MAAPNPRFNCEMNIIRADTNETIPCRRTAFYSCVRCTQNLCKSCSVTCCGETLCGFCAQDHWKETRCAGAPDKRAVA